MIDFEVVDVGPLLDILDFCLAGIVIWNWNNKISVISVLSYDVQRGDKA